MKRSGLDLGTFNKWRGPNNISIIFCVVVPGFIRTFLKRKRTLIIWAMTSLMKVSENMRKSMLKKVLKRRYVRSLQCSLSFQNDTCIELLSM